MGSLTWENIPSPRSRGEGRGEGQQTNCCPFRPLTLTLSPASAGRWGEGMLSHSFAVTVSLPAAVRA